MNISNLSQDTIVSLVKLAIESQPTKSCSILLENVPPALVTKSVEIDRRYYDVVHYALADQQVSAIKTLRDVSGIGLKEARDTIRVYMNADNRRNPEYTQYSQHIIDILNSIHRHQ